MLLKTAKILLLVLLSGSFSFAVGLSLRGTDIRVLPAKIIEVEPPEQINVYDLWTLTNTERTKAGKPTLSLNPKLNQSAKDKCDHMVEYDYWAHTAPDGTEPWYFIKKYTVFYKAGENLAYGQGANKRVIGDLMNSPTHRDNMLDPVFTDVGYGICDFRNRKSVVQHFAQL